MAPVEAAAATGPVHPTFPCAGCPKEYRSKSGLWYHRSRVHCDAPVYKTKNAAGRAMSASKRKRESRRPHGAAAACSPVTYATPPAAHAAPLAAHAAPLAPVVAQPQLAQGGLVKTAVGALGATEVDWKRKFEAARRDAVVAAEGWVEEIGIVAAREVAEATSRADAAAQRADTATQRADAAEMSLKTIVDRQRYAGGFGSDPGSPME